MRNSPTTTNFLSLLVLLVLTACTTNPHSVRPEGLIQAQDHETADLADITTDTLKLAEKTDKENILVVFDIDNTLLAMEQGLGSDQWYEWQKELSKESPCSPQYVGDRFAVQGALYFSSAMRPTQENGAQQVKAIQDLGVSVIALTSRGPDFQLQTFRELRRNNFNFNYTAIGPAGGYDEQFIPVEEGRASLYEDGVFMTAGQHKGQMLSVLLQKTGIRMPAVIVMVDDKQKNLDAVKETFSALNVPVHAWRYTGEDQNVREFNPEQADLLWQSIDDALRQIQQALGPDNYDLSGAVPPPECDQPVSSSPVSGD
ncbi:MAG: DUF2608 domain-containing protein [Xanthomonadales bacterium]|nr:DUF2608 domain-containing protein [Xanthomonadales bacterium]